MKTLKTYSYKKNLKAAFILILPAFLLYTFFEIVPIIQAIYFSLCKWNGMATTSLRFVGLDNFKELFKDENFYTALKNTLWFTLCNPLIQIPLALLLALALATYCKGFKFFKAVFFLPIILSASAVGLMWYFILMPGTGVLSTLLNTIGLSSWDHNWLVDKGIAFNIVILINSWIWAGYYMIIYFAAITSINQDIFDSAKMDGVYGLKRVFYIILPMIKDVLFVSVILQITGNLKAFDIIWVLTRGGPNYQTNVLTTLLFSNMKYHNYGLGNAVSIIIVVLSFIITVLSMKVMNRDNA